MCHLTSVCGTVAQVLALPPHSKKVLGSIPAWGAVGSGGQVLPRVHGAQVGYLPFCVEFACSPRVHKGFPPLRTPTEKHAKRTEQSCPSLTEMDGLLGPRALRSCPLLLGGPGGRTVRDGYNAERTFHSDLRPACARVCVCVSCVASIYACVCAIKTLQLLLFQ